MIISTARYGMDPGNHGNIVIDEYNIELSVYTKEMARTFEMQKMNRVTAAHDKYSGLVGH